jgi:hypothetical protein
LCKKIRSANVDTELVIEVSDRCGSDRSERNRAGAVNEHVDVAVARDEFVPEGTNGLIAREIADVCFGVVTARREFCTQCVERVLAASDKAYRGAA